jgi:hypothetical protein
MNSIIFIEYLKNLKASNYDKFTKEAKQIKLFLKQCKARSNTIKWKSHIHHISDIHLLQITDNINLLNGHSNEINKISDKESKIILNNNLNKITNEDIKKMRKQITKRINEINEIVLSKTDYTHDNYGYMDVLYKQNSEYKNIEISVRDPRMQDCPHYSRVSINHRIREINLEYYSSYNLSLNNILGNHLNEYYTEFAIQTIINCMSNDELSFHVILLTFFANYYDDDPCNDNPCHIYDPNNNDSHNEDDSNNSDNSDDSDNSDNSDDSDDSDNKSD